MKIEEIKKECINYTLEMHLNSLKALSLTMITSGRRPNEVIDMLSDMHNIGTEMVIGNAKDMELDKDYIEFLTLQLNSIYKEAYEVAKKYYTSYKGILINEEWEGGELYEESGKND